MGQEASTPIDEATPPQTLEKRDLASVAHYIQTGRAKKIAVMVGAGISTSAGIPDFRSPNTGLYANLSRLDLPYAEAVFDISYFRQNPRPFYTLARELYPGKYRPTITHSFVRLLCDKGLLLKLFTQNIDCLEREAGVPGNKIVEAHGSFARHGCIECQTSYPEDLMRDKVLNGEVPHCVSSECDGLVKPGIVFFGEPLPEEFHQNRSLPAAADLCIVLGTSLTVQPFASLPGFCSEGVPRILINLERVGGLGSRADDVLILGECDDGVRKLAAAVGWLDELESLWQQTNPDQTKPPDTSLAKSKDESLEDEIEKMTNDVDTALRFSQDHETRVRGQLDKAETAVNGTPHADKKEVDKAETAVNGTPQVDVTGKKSISEAVSETPSAESLHAEVKEPARVQSTEPRDGPVGGEDEKKEPKELEKEKRRDDSETVSSHI
ncbi:MAG: Sir2 histone deacetylase Hst2 [Piccolia ochrophora]|nr:MAG: Sir2 histone deacetylase Hst2 [Piccolia ochrophora]